MLTVKLCYCDQTKRMLLTPKPALQHLPNQTNVSVGCLEHEQFFLFFSQSLVVHYLSSPGVHTTANKSHFRVANQQVKLS